MSDVYMNGRFVPEGDATVSVFDRAVQLGDGLFETIRGHFGRPAFLEKHLQRIRTSAAFLKIPFARSDREIQDALVELCRRNNAPEARVRLTLTRGVHPGGLPIEGGTPLLVATSECYTPHTPDKYEEGYKLVVSSLTHFSKGALTGHKTLNYLEFLLSRDEASEAGADEALLLNERGNVAECSSANVFCVKSGSLVTPDLRSGILPGVVRDVVIRLSADAGIPVQEKDLSVEEFLGADEVFVTSSLRGVMPVAEIGEKIFAKERPVTEKLSHLYSDALDADCRE